MAGNNGTIPRRELRDRGPEPALDQASGLIDERARATLLAWLGERGPASSTRAAMELRWNKADAERHMLALEQLGVVARTGETTRDYVLEPSDPGRPAPEWAVLMDVPAPPVTVPLIEREPEHVPDVPPELNAGASALGFDERDVELAREQLRIRYTVALVGKVERGEIREDLLDRVERLLDLA